MNKIYSFERNLAFSEENQQDERWNQAYREFFPELSHIELVSDNESQDRGVDKIVYMKEGQQYNIDEKVDRKGYPRFPIEIWQDYKRRYPGWAVKEGQKTDYIAYLIFPLQHYYLIPYEDIKAALQKNYQQWLDNAKNYRDGFVYGKAWNDKKFGNVWETHNVCVPFDILRNHIPSIQLWEANEYE